MVNLIDVSEHQDQILIGRDSMLTTGARDAERQSGEFASIGSTTGSEVMTNQWPTFLQTVRLAVTTFNQLKLI